MAAVIPTISLDLKLANLVVAKIIPYYLIPYGIGALIYAPLTKHFSYRRILGFALILYSFFTFYCGSVHSLRYFLFGRIGMGITAACAIPLGLMIIGEFFEKKVRGRLVGLFFSCSFFASLAGIVLGGVTHWRWLFFVPAFLGLITALCLWRVKLDLLKNVHGVSINYLKAFKDKDILNIFVFIFLISFLYHGVHKWFGIYLSQIYALDKLWISFFFVVVALGGALGQIVGGHLSDKRGRLITCRIGVIGLALSVMLLIGNYPLFILGIIFCFISVFWTIGHNGLSTLLTDFPDKDRPVIASLNSSVRFISGGLGFFISRIFVEQNFGLTFFVIGILIILLNYLINRLLR